MAMMPSSKKTLNHLTTNMKFSELQLLVNSLQHADRHADAEVMVKIKLPYTTIGAVPMVPVKSMSMGFDWEAGKFIVWPAEELTPNDRDFAKQMRDMQEKLGWAELENRKLKAEITRLKKQLATQHD